MVRRDPLKSGMALAGAAAQGPQRQLRLKQLLE
jgi:hypothetical protein